MPSFNTTDLPEVHFKQGEKLLVEGEKCDSVFVLKRGAVTITAGGSEICRINEVNSVFGEISALCGCLPTATVTITETSTFYRIEDFRAYLEKNGDAGLALAEILAGRLVQMNDKFLEFKKTLDSTFNPNASVKDQFSNLILCFDSILGRSIF